MAGIKISQLPKWGITDLEQIDAADILIPTSVNNITGCLKANTLVNFLKNTPSDIDAVQNANISNLNERLLYLSSVLDSFMAEMNRKYSELLETVNSLHPNNEENNGEDDNTGNDSNNENNNNDGNGVSPLMTFMSNTNIDSGE